jgi:archaellum biogenesis ATPase FlaH
MRISEADVIPQLKNVKRVTNGWTASCPAHPDKHPSFSVLEQDDGNLYLKCHKGCSFVQIVQTLGLNEGEQNSNVNKTQKRIVAEYDYVDENGEVIYQAIRYEPKNFNFRRPDSNGNWIYNIQGVKRIPYKLPELLEAKVNELPVILCEGEADVNNVMEKLGFIATTTPQGANSWNNNYAEYFDGLDVIILPDNDISGLKYANDAALSLWGIAKSVKVIKLPNLPDKGDVSNWIDMGGTTEELKKLIVETNEWTPDENPKEATTANQDFFIIKKANDCIFEAKQKPVPKMLFGEFWFEDELSILFADSGTGKSLLAVQIADSITNGKRIKPFNLEIESQKVLYFDFELGARQFTNRYAMNIDGYFQEEYKFNDSLLRVTMNPDANLLNGSSFERMLFDALENAVTETDAKILIVDNITYLNSNNEKAKEALPLMKHLKALKEKYNLSILALAHTPKRYLDKELTQNDLAGSKMLMNFCDSSFAIGKSGKDENLRYIKQIKQRNTENLYGTCNVAICQIVNPNNFTSFEFLKHGNERDLLKIPSSNDRMEMIQQVGELKRQGRTHRQISSHLVIAVGSVTNYLKEFEELQNNSDSVQPAQPLFDMNNMNEVNNDGDMSHEI